MIVVLAGNQETTKTVASDTSLLTYPSSKITAMSSTPFPQQSQNAGNAGDVLKHAVLAWCLHHLVERGHPVRYLETHAGAGRYRVPAGDDNRAHLFRGLPPQDRTRTGPYFRALQKLLVGQGADLSYPGSPLIATTLLGDASAHAAAFFEAHEETARALQALLPKRFPVAIGRSAVAETAGNPFLPSAQTTHTVPFVLVDPFGYRPHAPDSELAHGRLNRDALNRIVAWTGELAGVQGQAIVAVWTHEHANHLAADLHDSAADRFRHFEIVSAGVRRLGIMTPYHLVVLGAGDVGLGVVRELPRPSNGEAAWEASPLLRLWEHRISFDVLDWTRP